MKHKIRIYITAIITVAVLFGVFAIASNILNDSDEKDVVQAYNTEVQQLPVTIRELMKIIEVQHEEPIMKPIEPGVIISENQPLPDEPTPTPPEPVNDVKLYCWKELRKAGFSEEATAGIMGNIEEEHHFQTSDTPNGLGICQWTKKRKEFCIAHCNQMGVPYTSIEGQASFMVLELTTSNKPIGSYLDNRCPEKATATYRETIQHGYSLLGETYKEPHEYSSLDEFKSTNLVDDSCLSCMGRFERCNSGYRVKDHFWYARSNERLHSARVLYSTYKGTEI